MTLQAIVGAKIYPVTAKPLKDGVLLWQDGKIIAVGRVGEVEIPPTARRLEGKGLVVTPGLIDPHTHIGIMEEVYELEGDDLNESAESAITPEMRALDGINPFDPAFQDALSGGVTTVMIAPGSANVIGGSVCVLKTAGPDLEEMVVDPAAGVKAAFGENPKRAFSEQKKMPVSRMGIAALLRQALVDAQDYAKKQEKSAGDKEVSERDLGLDVLVRLLQREIPLRAHAHRADDMHTAIRIAREFNLRLILEHGTEAHRLLGVLQKEGIPVVVGPSFSNRAKVEMAQVGWEVVKTLTDAGVLLALTTDHSCTPIQYLSLCGAMAVRYGLTWDQALAAITINPAKILGLSDRLGSLAPGKDSDFAVFDGDPFHYRTRCLATFVDGRQAWARQGWVGQNEAGQGETGQSGAWGAGR